MKSSVGRNRSDPLQKKKKKKKKKKKPSARVRKTLILVCMCSLPRGKEHHAEAIQST
jgi:hypothetical protein